MQHQMTVTVVLTAVERDTPPKPLDLLSATENLRLTQRSGQLRYQKHRYQRHSSQEYHGILKQRINPEPRSRLY